MNDRRPGTLTRRRVLTGTAWAVPAVTLATAAPAFALSPQPSNALILESGTTGVVSSVVDDTEFFDLEFQNMSLVVDGTPTAGARLQLTVAFRPLPGLPASGVYVVDLPPGFTGRVGEVVRTATLVSASAPAGGSTVAIPDGKYFGAEWHSDLGRGTFDVTYSLAGLTPVTASFATPAVPTPAAAPFEEAVSRDDVENQDPS